MLCTFVRQSVSYRNISLYYMYRWSSCELIRYTYNPECRHVRENPNIYTHDH